MIAAFLLLTLGVGGAAGEVEEAEHYDSLAALTRHADAVVLGQVVAAVPGQLIDGCGFTAATVEIQEILAGHLLPRSEKRLTLQYFDCGTPPELGAGIPTERAVFFLRNGGVIARMAKQSQAEVERQSVFWHLVILAGTAVDVGGKVHIPQTNNAPFLAKLEGTSFGRFVSGVRALALDVPDTARRPLSVQTGTNMPVIPLVAGLVALLAIAPSGLRRQRIS